MQNNPEQKKNFEHQFVDSWEGWDEMEITQLMFYDCILNDKVIEKFSHLSKIKKYDVVVNFGDGEVSIYEKEGDLRAIFTYSANY